MANKGSFLSVGAYLAVGDYIASASGLFYAIMQSDGNFVVYRGAGPQDSGKYGPCLWSANNGVAQGDYYAVMQSDSNLVVYKGAAPPAQNGAVWAANPGSLTLGDYYAIMQDDGNLVVYKGAAPPTQSGVVWATNKLDEITNVEIQNVIYDVTNAQILNTTPDGLYSQSISNNTSTTQSSVINGSASTTETSGWSDSLAVKVGASTSLKVGFPIIAEGKVTVSVDVTNTYTWNGSVSNTKTWGFSTPVSVPPGCTSTVAVSVSISNISVPYTLTGLFTLQSGYQVPGIVNGTYSGVCSHNLVVSFNDVSTSTAKQVSRSSKALQPTSVRIGPERQASGVPAAA